MDHSVALLLDALTDYHARDRYGFTPPGHRQGRGADPRTRAAIGEDAFRSDVLSTAGLDDRRSSHGYLSRAADNAVPVIDCTAGERKHLIAEEYLRTHPVGPGVFMILVARAPAMVWDVRRPADGTVTAAWPGSAPT